MTRNHLPGFPSIVGHQSRVEELDKLLAGDTLPHALLFAGPRGVGKRVVAQALALGLLTKSSAKVSSKSSGQIHPDLHLVVKEIGKKDISVEAVRSLRAVMQLKPYYGGNSLAIIDHADKMSIAASNALLMTLEEAPAGKYLILVTDAPQRLPETVVSRCQVFHFGELSEPEVTEILNIVLAGISDLEPLIPALTDLCGSSLSALHLDDFINPQTLTVLDEKKLSQHLNELVEQTKAIRAQVNLFVEGVDSGKDMRGIAVRLGAELAADKTRLPLVWQLTRSLLRKRLREAGESVSPRARAAQLLETLEIEQRTAERSLNPQLQLSSLFVKLAAGR